MKIAKTFATLLEAVTASGIDLSYNKPLALCDIAQLEKKITNPMLMEDGSVMYVYDGKQYGKLLNKFSPFSKCIDNRPFRIAVIKDDEIVMHDTLIDKSDHKLRSAVSKMGFVLA